MAWPLPQDYNEAIQNPRTSFSDAELCGGRPVLNALGLPLPRSGNFADVYEFAGAGGARWAVKCFTRAVPGLQERYAEISTFLHSSRLPFTVDFQYLPEGIRIRGQWYPVLKMQWVAGFLLNEFIRDNLDKPHLLEKLLGIWVRMGKRLHEAGMAHADLQHGNVILVPASRATALSVRLIDYDGMFVPALANTTSGELGHASYQHPERIQRGVYNASVDRLPLLAVACSLSALSVEGKDLWQRYDNGDNLLFREADLRNPGDSALLRELWHLPDKSAHDLAGYVTLAVSGSSEHVPLLHEVLCDDGQLRPLSQAQSGQVADLLGSNASSRRITATASPAAVPTWEKLDEAIPTSRKMRNPRRKTRPAWALWVGGLAGALLLVIGLAAFTRKVPRPVAKQSASAVPQSLGALPLRPTPQPSSSMDRPPLTTPQPINPQKEASDKPATPVSQTTAETGPPYRIQAVDKVSWDDLVLRRAEVSEGLLHVQADGHFATKKGYSGPIEINVLARSDDKPALWISAFAHTINFQLGDKEWHKFRVAMTEKAIETWIDGVQSTRSDQPGITRAATPVRVYIKGDDKVALFKSLEIRHIVPETPPVAAETGRWDKVVLKNAEVQGELVRLSAVGSESASVETKQKFGPLELTLVVRCNKGIQVQAFSHSHGFSFAGDNWHTLRLAVTESTVEFAMDAGNPVRLPRRNVVAYAEPVRVYVQGQQASAEIKSLDVRAIASIPPETASGAAPVPAMRNNPVLNRTPVLERLATPSATALAAARQQVAELCGPQPAKGDFKAQAKYFNSLLQASYKNKEPALRFQCLRELKTVSVQRGNINFAFHTIDRLSAAFTIDTLQEMLDAFSEGVQTHAPNEALLEAALRTADEIQRTDRFSAIPRLVAAARQFVSRRTTMDRRYTTALEDRLNQLDKIAKEYKKFKAAYPAQEAEPQDSKERLALGRYCAFIKEDWTKGLPLLAASNDAFLAEPARKDLLARQSAAKAADAGETWLALAEQEKGIAKTNLQKRAKHCFVVAYSLLPDAHKSNVTEPLKLRHGDSYLLPGLQGEFFQGGRLIKQRVDPQLRFRDGFASVDPDLTNSAFTAKWKGYLWLAQPQQLNFGVQCTGAFDIRLDNQRLLSSTKEKISISTSRFLLDGLHTVEIIYQNNGGDAAFELTTTTFGNRFAPAEREPPLFYHRPKKKTP